jgi:8-amino-7-oxononanoate synthase
MFEDELAQLDKKHLRRRLMVVDSYDGPRITVNGRSVLLLCSNDYLGMANHPALCKAACEAMKRYGFGAGASRLVSGSSEVHHELERRLARFKGTEAAVVFNSGYAANTGVIQSIAGEGDVVLSDCMNHASIVDGCRLCKADVHVYRHNDLNHVEEILKKSSTARRKLIVTDGVFSMDGDIAPLPGLVLLSEKYGAIVMVDDAHATGVLGKSGKGTVEHFGLAGRVHIHMGTLGKALGAFGAFVAGNRDLIEFLINRARSFIYSTALPPSVCAASIAALDVVETEPMRRENLWKNRERFVAGLKVLGISTGVSETPIVPVMIGDSAKALKAADKLFEYGVYATAIRPPTVPNGTARIRSTLMSTLSNQDIDMAVALIGRLKQEGYLS